MRSEWTSYKIGEIFELVNGYAFKSSDFISSGIPVLKIKNVKPNNVVLDDLSYVSVEVASRRNDKAIRRGDILITMSGNRFDGSKDTWVGKVAYFDISGHYMLNQRVGVLRSREGVVIDRKCAAYFLSSDDYQKLFISIATSSGGQANLSPAQILGEQLHLPPIEEQARISELLGGLDDRITLLRETNATLEAIAQALFKSWFVDFDPVRAKAEGRARQDGERSGQPRMPQASDLPRPGAEAGAEAQGQPEGAIQGSMSAAEGRMPKAAMDAATAALFPDSFEESELGLVPKGWVVKPVGDVVDCLGGGTPDTKEPSYWEPAEHCWTTPKDLSGLQSPVLLRTERQLSTLGLAKVSSGLLPAGTLLLSSRAPIGYLAIAQMPVAVNQGYIAIPRGGELSPLYMLFWCRQNMEAIKGRANGSTFMEISKKAFRPIPALVPTVEVLDAFANIAEPLFERLIENERQAQTLTQLRDALLPRLISGQLRLPEAQALAAEAV